MLCFGNGITRQQGISGQIRLMGKLPGTNTYAAAALSTGCFAGTEKSSELAFLISIAAGTVQVYIHNMYVITNKDDYWHPLIFFSDTKAPVLLLCFRAKPLFPNYLSNIHH
jgi:hypothetical protein